MSKKLIKLLAVVLTVALGTIGCTKSNKIDDNNVVKVNKNRKLQIIVGVSSFLIIVVVVILFSIIGIKRSLKKRATLWK